MVSEIRNVAAMTKTSIDRATNIFGALDATVQARLSRCLQNPTTETWNEAYSIILNGKTLRTLWQAVLAVDPTFPRTGPVVNSRGGLVKGWTRIPDRFTLQRAIRQAVSEGGR